MGVLRADAATCNEKSRWLNADREGLLTGLLLAQVGSQWRVPRSQWQSALSPPLARAWHELAAHYETLDNAARRALLQSRVESHAQPRAPRREALVRYPTKWNTHCRVGWGDRATEEEKTSSSIQSCYATPLIDELEQAYVLRSADSGLQSMLRELFDRHAAVADGHAAVACGLAESAETRSDDYYGDGPSALAPAEAR